MGDGSKFKFSLWIDDIFALLLLQSWIIVVLAVNWNCFITRCYKYILKYLTSKNILPVTNSPRTGACRPLLWNINSLIKTVQFEIEMTCIFCVFLGQKRRVCWIPLHFALLITRSISRKITTNYFRTIESIWPIGKQTFTNLSKPVRTCIV